MRVATIARRFLVGSVLLLWLCGTALLIWLMLVYPNEPCASTSRDVPIELPPGATLEQVAASLTRARVIVYPRAFIAYFRLLGVAPHLRIDPSAPSWVVGNAGLGVRQQLPRLARGYGQSSVDVVVPEGFTRFDVATRLARFGVAPRDALLRAMEDRLLLASLDLQADSAEGYLFPALYRFLQDSPPERVITRMVATFRTRTQGLFEAHALAGADAPSAQLTPHQLVTLASIVEREARMPEERPTIAGVFMNRLLDPDFKPKRLQADPTVAYGCLVAGDRVPSCRDFDGRHITPAMVRDSENPYSTYRHEGLPPGPICNPGLSSLEAALSPEPHRFFYFVAKGGGRHAFSTTLGEHNQNVRPAEVVTDSEPSQPE